MAVQIIKDFEHAAVEKPKVFESDRLVAFAAPLGDSPRGMWFHFKVSGGDGENYTFVLTNIDQLLGGHGFGHVVPVFRHGDGDWQRVDPEKCVAGEPSEALFSSRYRPTASFFQFEAPCGPEITEIAYSFPYTAEMIDEALERWSTDRNVTIETICKSRGGRPVQAVRIGKPSKNKKLVWVLARQHAGETPGSYAAEGLVDAILGKAKWAQGLRRRATVYVVPAVDVDAVADGEFGKDRGPVDFNRDWCAYPKRPEIKALREAMDKSRAKCGGKNAPMLAMLDLHAPSPSDVSFPVPPHPAWAGRESWQRVWWFSKLIERHSQDSAPLRWANSSPQHIDWSPPGVGPKVASGFHAACGLAEYSMTVELTYNWQANAKLVERDDWRRMGQALARALEAAAKGTKPPRNVRVPDPPFYLGQSWDWLQVPRQCNAKVNGEVISIQADGPQGYAALLFRRPLKIGRGRFRAVASVSRTSHKKCPVQRYTFFFRNGIFTGEVTELTSELGSQNNLQWRGPTQRKRPADEAMVAVVIRNWPGTITIQPPELSKK